MSKNTGSVLTAALRNRTNGVLGGLLFVFLAIFIGITVAVNMLSSRDEQYLENAGELRVLSQELAKNAVEAASGKKEAFAELKTARDNFADHWGNLKNGNDESNLSPADFDVMPQVDDLWNKVRGNADQII